MKTLISFQNCSTTMKRTLLGGLLLAGVLTGCSKDEEVLCVSPEPDTLAFFTKRHAPPVQVFEFDPSRPQVLRTAAGATITIKANSFSRPDSSLPRGPVKLLYQEVYTPADMLLANVPTMSWLDEPLESGGEVNIRVMEGKTRLTLHQALFTGMRLKMQVPPRMSTRNTMYQWIRLVKWDNLDSVSWYPQETGSREKIVVTTTIDSATRNYHIKQWPDSLGWLTCNAYPDPARLLKVAVDVPGGLAETRVFLVPTARNGLFQPRWNWRTQRAELSGIAEGTELTAVILRVRDGKYYFGTERALAQDGRVYRPQLQVLTEAEVVRRIKQL